MARTIVIALAALSLVACQGDTGFTAGDNNTDDLQGTGDYTIIPDGEILFEDLIPTCTETQWVRLDSIGEENLVISKIDITVSGGGTFEVATPEGVVGAIEGVTVEIGEAYEFTVRATMPSLKEAVGELRIASNDDDELDKRVALRAVATEDGWDTGDSGDPCQ